MMTLADAIIAEDLAQINMILMQGQNVNTLDEYGFTPLVEAAIADNIAIANMLLQYGADPNLPDSTGGTALHWAAENNNMPLCQLLLQHYANPNAYTLSGQPVLAMPLLRQQSQIKKFLLDNGADLEFAQDYMNTKLLGHMFELVGTANIISPDNQFVEIDFEGFYLEISLGMIADSLMHFKNHFAARHLRRYSTMSHTLVNTVLRAAELARFQQYRIDIDKHRVEIDTLIRQEPLLIPVGYEGHAITYIKSGSIFVKCDRREDSRLYDNIMIYQIGDISQFTTDFVKHLLYEKQSEQYINQIMPAILKLSPVTEIKVPAQISGNCSWANVEACIPVIHFLVSTSNADFQENIAHYKAAALKYFDSWRQWNQDRSLHFCIQSLKHSDTIRRVCKAEIMAAILFQCCNKAELMNRERIEQILAVLTHPEYEYILLNYIKTYCYEDHGEEGKNFLRMLRNSGYKLPR